MQFLPVNDTILTHTWQDSYPYNAVSVYALHPLYINLDDLPAPDEKLLQAFNQKREALNALPQVDYEAALQLKLDYLHAVYQAHGQEALATGAFRQFFVNQVTWLPAYAMFSVLRDKYQTAHFANWPEHAKFSYDALLAFCAPKSPEYNNVCFNPSFSKQVNRVGYYKVAVIDYLLFHTNSARYYNYFPSYRNIEGTLSNNYRVLLKNWLISNGYNTGKAMKADDYSSSVSMFNRSLLQEA